MASDLPRGQKVSRHLGPSFMKCRFMGRLGRWVQLSLAEVRTRRWRWRKKAGTQLSFLDLLLGQNFEQVKNTSLLFDRVGKGFPGGSFCKESACQYRRLRFDPWIKKIPRRRECLPTPVFLPGKSHGQSLVGHSPWGHKGLDMTEILRVCVRTCTHTHTHTHTQSTSTWVCWSCGEDWWWGGAKLGDLRGDSGETDCRLGLEWGLEVGSEVTLEVRDRGNDSSGSAPELGVIIGWDGLMTEVPLWMGWVGGASTLSTCRSLTNPWL